MEQFISRYILSILLSSLKLNYIRRREDEKAGTNELKLFNEVYIINKDEVK